MRIARLKNEEILPENASVDLDLINGVIEKYKGKRGNLIPVLQGVQNIFGYIPKDAFLKLNRDLGLKLNDMYGVATFYAQFRLKPVGKYIVKVCHGTACHVQNASKLTEAIEEVLNVKDGETTEDGLFTLESVACLGCCSLAPVMMIEGETYGKLDGKKAGRIIKDIKLKDKSLASN